MPDDEAAKRGYDVLLTRGLSMRCAFLVPCLLLAGCEEAPPAAPPQPAAAAGVSPGQWEVTRTLTELTKLDDGAPAIRAAVGSAETLSLCVTPGQETRPPADLLIGRADAGCTSNTLYLSGGRANASLACRPKGLGGTMNFSADGTYTADTVKLSVGGSTQLAGSGDVRTTETLVARRTGACTPATKPGGTT